MKFHKFLSSFLRNQDWNGANPCSQSTKYIFFLVLIIAVSLFLTVTISNEVAKASTDAKTTRTIDVRGQKEHSHEAETHDDDKEKGHERRDEHEGEGINLTPQAVKEAGIVVEKLKPRMLSTTLELPGEVIPHPKGEGFVGSLVEGRIKEIFVDVGDRVSKGEPLCIIESPAVGEAEAAYITTLAELQFLKADLDRHNTLVGEGIGSQKELLELQAALSSSSSAVSAAKRTLQAYGFNEEDIKMLESDQHTGGRVTLRSPTSGKVINRDARLGKQVTPELDLFHIVDLKKLRVHVDIPEKYLGELSKGIEFTIVSQNSHHSNVTGVIDRLGDSIETETRSFAAFATVDNSAGNLTPGAFVTVRFSIVSGEHKVLAVPLAAVFRDKHGDQSLFVELKRGNFNLREIETGVSTGGWIEITAGVSAGERVVTIGAFAVKSEADKSKFGDGHGH